MGEGGAPGDESNPAAQKVGEYIRELLAEKLSIDQHPHAARLIDQGNGGRRCFVRGAVVHARCSFVLKWEAGKGVILSFHH